MKFYLELMRLDKPIGILLLLWPPLWALFIASNGRPDLWLVMIFVLGVVVMRSAGCVINDIADRHWDGFVERTKHRPLVCGKITIKKAWMVLAVLLLIAFFLVLPLNKLAIQFSLGALFFTLLYPFTKRFIQMPQAVLGIAFAWSVPMAFAASLNQVPWMAWILFFAVVCWVIAYDTVYAMVDREDDVKVGIKSSAILFGQYDLIAIASLQLLTLALLLVVGLLSSQTLFYYVSLGLVALLWIRHLYIIRCREKAACFQVFLQNAWVGVLVFLGLLLGYLFTM